MSGRSVCLSVCRSVCLSVCLSHSPAHCYHNGLPATIAWCCLIRQYNVTTSLCQVQSNSNATEYQISICHLTGITVFSLQAVRCSVYRQYGVQFTGCTVFSLQALRFSVYRLYGVQFTGSTVFSLQAVRCSVYRQYGVQFTG